MTGTLRKRGKSGHRHGERAMGRWSQRLEPRLRESRKAQDFRSHRKKREREGWRLP